MRRLEYYIRKLKETGMVRIWSPDYFRTDWIEAEVRVKGNKVSVKINKPYRSYEETKRYESEEVAMDVAVLWVESLWEEARECYKRYKELEKRYNKLQDSIDGYDEWSFMNTIGNQLAWNDKSLYYNYDLGKIEVEYIGAAYRIRAVNFKTDEVVEALAGDDVEACEIALNIFRRWN